MKVLLEKTYVVPARYLLLFIFIAFIGIFIYYAREFADNDKELYGTVLVSLSTGLIIALVQFILFWREQKIIDAFENMGIAGKLPARDMRKYYSRIIESTSERLWIMGNTGSRLVDDFAVGGKTSNLEDKALIRILEKGVYVKILIGNKHKLNTESKKIFDSTKEKFKNLSNQYPNVLQVKYFNHTPNHSIFVFDNECFLGPIFENIPSRETPSIHMKTNSEFAKQYLDAFNYEWTKAEVL